MPFQPGPSGNPLGRPKGSCNKTRRAVREWATGIVEDPQVQARLLADARTGKLHPSVLTVLMTYVYGRPNPRDVPEPETAITIERARISYAAGRHRWRQLDEPDTAAAHTREAASYRSQRDLRVRAARLTVGVSETGGCNTGSRTYRVRAPSRAGPSRI